VSTGEIEDAGTGMLVFFEDPDGNEICLWQYR
jgi:predicted enzyme related to lactoylglutathione lyase